MEDAGHTIGLVCIIREPPFCLWIFITKFFLAGLGGLATKARILCLDFIIKYGSLRAFGP